MVRIVSCSVVSVSPSELADGVPYEPKPERVSAPRYRSRRRRKLPRNVTELSEAVAEEAAVVPYPATADVRRGKPLLKKGAKSG